MARKTLLGISAISAAALLTLAVSHTALAHGLQSGSGPGSGMTVGQMGPGMGGFGAQGGMMGPQGQGFGMGPGMGGFGAQGQMMGPQGQGFGMGSGMGGFGAQGRMGPGFMMTPQGQGFQMGPGMMMDPGMGFGGMGAGGMGFGPRFGTARDLEPDEVKHFLEHRIEVQGYGRLKVGKVEEKDNDTITAEIVTEDGTLVQRLEVDRHSGRMQEVK